MSRSLFRRNGSSRPCPCCRGKGYTVEHADGGGATDGVFSYELPCEECDGTGQKWSTPITTESGATATVHGSRELDAESQAALERILQAAVDRMEST